ncbi:hypothetical protein HPP92_003045, partial [Vanilla planifolia]
QKHRWSNYYSTCFIMQKNVELPEIPLGATLHCWPIAFCNSFCPVRILLASFGTMTAWQLY